MPRLLGEFDESARAPPPGSAPARRNRAGRSRRRRRRSMPSGSMPVIRQPSPARPSRRLRIELQSHRRDPRSYARRISGSAAASALMHRRQTRRSRALDPVDPAEAGDEMAALDRDPIETEIGKAGIDGARRVVRGEAGAERADRRRRSARPSKRQPRPGQRVGIARGASNSSEIRGSKAILRRVLGEIGQQQQRARIEIAGDSDERDIGRAARLVASAAWPRARISRRRSPRSRVRHSSSLIRAVEPCRGDPRQAPSCGARD